MKRTTRRVLLPTVLLACATALAADSGAARERLNYSARADGISCKYFDVALNIAWPQGRPEWRDADNRPDGTRPFATDRMEAGDKRRVRRADVLALVHGWWQGRFDNDGVLVQLAAGSHVVFHAREEADRTLRPQLLLRFADGRTRYLEPVADAALACSTYTGLGTEPRLALMRQSPLALRFDIERERTNDAEPPIAAELVLVRTPDSPAAAAEMVVQRLYVPFRAAPPAPPAGLARAYPGDVGIERDPDVLFADGFDRGKISGVWKRGMAAPYAVVEHDEANGFWPLAGPALKVTIPRGGAVGLDLRYPFKQQHGSEPDEMYFRYYLRLARSWSNASDGGKLPGFAGTYGVAGWGGRPWSGAKGWSMRGHFGLKPPATHAAAGKTMLGSYAYHSKTSLYGEGLPWAQASFAGLIGPDRWVCVEQYLKLNAPGREDGVLRVWVDERLAFENTSLRLRDLPRIHIEEVWMNVFHGGTATAPAAMHAYIDGVVIARRYIGPMTR